MTRPADCHGAHDAGHATSTPDGRRTSGRWPCSPSSAGCPTTTSNRGLSCVPPPTPAQSTPNERRIDARHYASCLESSCIVNLSICACSMSLTPLTKAGPYCLPNYLCLRAGGCGGWPLGGGHGRAARVVLRQAGRSAPGLGTVRRLLAVHRLRSVRQLQAARALLPTCPLDPVPFTCRCCPLQ